MMSRHRDPIAFIELEPAFGVLRDGRADDATRVANLSPVAESAGGAVYLLPDAQWSRRVSGVFANDLARADRQRAHAVLVAKPGGYAVSVRAPRVQPTGADALCRRFSSGGGRAAAAGINMLQEAELDAFIAAFRRAF